MQSLHNGLHALRNAHIVGQLLVIPAYVLDILCIHPFPDGNGRMARLLTLFLLYQAGYAVGRFISLEQLIENSRRSYYDTLHKSSQGWHEGRHDLTPWTEYLLGTLVEAYRVFESRVGQVTTAKGAKTHLVEDVIEDMTGEFTAQDVLAKCPTASLDLVRRILTHDAAERGPQSLDFTHFEQTRTAQRLCVFPVGERPLGKPVRREKKRLPTCRRSRSADTDIPPRGRGVAETARGPVAFRTAWALLPATRFGRLTGDAVLTIRFVLVFTRSFFPLCKDRQRAARSQADLHAHLQNRIPRPQNRDWEQNIKPLTSPVDLRHQSLDWAVFLQEPAAGETLRVAGPVFPRPGCGPVPIIFCPQQPAHP
jgi:hypothetical protein